MIVDLFMPILSLLSLVLALIPAILTALNLRRYRPAPPPAPESDLPAVSVLIPARDEEQGIGQTVRAALSSRGIRFEVIVLDDHSQDATRRIVEELSAVDPRVRVLPAPSLPAGWSGKQHACLQLAKLANHPLLLFLDADVRLEPDALARSATFLRTSGADLVSGIPRQETEGFWENLVIPLIHFVLLGFLPIHRMRRSTSTAYAAGCGQFFLTTKAAYERSGGHAKIRATFHDGIKLPRAYRLAGLKTDLFDPTDLATCRMYRSSSALWNGLAKNAVEGLGSPRLIVPMTSILLLGQVFPLMLFMTGLGYSGEHRGFIMITAGLAIAACYYPRLAMRQRFHQSMLGAFLHPLSVLVLVTIQWVAAIQALLGIRVSWKGRNPPGHSCNLEELSKSLSHSEREFSHGFRRTVEDSP